jgi:predicted RecB family nuclease
MHLSKSRFTAGLQCHKLLWWKVHEPLAVELEPDKVLQDRFDQGAQVGALAREQFAPGTLIDLPHREFEQRVARTRDAINAGAPAIFEASFMADETFVAVDVLTRMKDEGPSGMKDEGPGRMKDEGPGRMKDEGFRVGDGWRMIEVKSSSSQKDEHVADAAVQLHVLSRSGLAVHAVEIMHLNKEFRHPDQGDLFVRADVTSEARALLPPIPQEITAQLEVLRGPLPSVDIGLHCHEPWKCPFMDRCWPTSIDHISRLYNVGPKKTADYMSAGVHTIGAIPPKQKLPPVAQRQIRSMKENRLLVEPGLGDALTAFDVRLGFLDFETVSRAVPVWPGMAPWEQAAAQFSYHEARGDGTYSHVGYLAEGSHDARPELVRAMLDATADAERVVMYSAFEKTQIRSLKRAVPGFTTELEALERKLIDLLPVLRENVYHPAFRGSFSIKAVLEPLVPDLSYKDLIIVDGLTASVEIARLLFVAQKIAPEERARVRKELLDYCERDTFAMVRLLERLRELAGIS